jgi:hypothetical protein
MGTVEQIRVIETNYQGYRFRSRLEARWALFFDALKLEWEYEPEGFALPNGQWYLPDFFIPFHGMRKHYPNAGYWVEIKGIPPTEEELEKLRLTCIGTKHHGYCMVGMPGANVPIAIDFLQRPAQELPPILADALAEHRKSSMHWAVLDELRCSAILACCREPPVEPSEFIYALELARGARF